MEKSRQFIILALVLLIAAYLRFQGLDWDKGYLFHPDERQILFVTTRIDLPTNLLDFFSIDSPLNPQFFSYGTFPIYLLRVLGGLAPAANNPVPWRDSSLVSFALMGRALSGLFDLGTIALIFLLGRRWFTAQVGLLAAAGVAFTVLHIQLSHFSAVDTLLTFFVVATMYCAARYAETAQPRDRVLMAIAFGLALATKISAAPLIVPLMIATIQARNVSSGVAVPVDVGGRWSEVGELIRHWISEVTTVRKPLAQIALISLAIFFITQPYALLDPIRFFGQTGTEALIARGWMDVPYTRQYINTLPFIYSIVQSSVWGMGLPLGIVAWVGSAIFVWRWWGKRDRKDAILLSWALVYFITIGGQHAKHLRYLLPLMPFLYLMAAALFGNHASRITFHVSRIAYSVGLLFAFIYSVSFAGIYSRDHPWFTISRWIYANIPAGATLALEHWDDNLPVSIRAPGEARAPIEYQLKTLPLYDPDDAAKLEVLADTLAASDYVVLASQRLYGVIPRLPARYPISTRYYAMLFSGELGFELAAFARNDPQLFGIPIADNAMRDEGLQLPPSLVSYYSNAWDWGRADESFTVYDHPMPLVFKKTRTLTSDNLYRQLSGEAQP